IPGLEEGSGRAGCQEMGPRNRSVNGDEWRACGQGGAETLPGRTEESGLTTTESSMSGIVVRRFRIVGEKVPVMLALMATLVVTPCPARAGLGSRHIDPAQVVPLAQIGPDRREVVAEVIRDHTFHRQGDSDAFPCPSSLYLSLVNEPSLTL